MNHFVNVINNSKDYKSIKCDFYRKVQQWPWYTFSQQTFSISYWIIKSPTFLEFNLVSYRCRTIHIDMHCSSYAPYIGGLKFLNPILGGLWNYVTGQGEDIMAQMDSNHPKAISRHPNAQKWLQSNFFDVWLSIDTKNSTLWALVLANLAVKRPWRKMKIFTQKYVKN